MPENNIAPGFMQIAAMTVANFLTDIVQRCFLGQARIKEMFFF
jgi:hypothetical protein